MREFGLTVRMAIASTVLLAVYLVIGLFLFAMAGGGVEGLLLAAVGLPVLIGAQYLLKVQWPLWTEETGEITRDDVPWLHSQADQLAEEFGISKPTMYLIEDNKVNAFVYGRRNNGRVFLSRGLLQKMSPDEVGTILAHEFAHLKNRDSILMGLGTSIVTGISAGLFLFSLIASLDSDHPWLVRAVGAAVSFFVQFFLSIFVGLLSRYREYVADENAVRATGNYKEMRSALSKLQSEKRRINGSDASATRSAISFVDYSGGIADLWLFRSHPSLENRISRIERLEAERGTDNSDFPSASSSAETPSPTESDKSVNSLTDRQLLSQLQSMDEYAFEHLVSDLWEEIGWRTMVTTGSKDRGIDVVAERESPFYQKQVIQAKRYSSDNPVSSSEVQQYAGLHLQEDNVDAVVVVTTSRFTSDAQDIAADSNVKLVDGERLCDMIRKVGTEPFVEKRSRE